jgi:exopolysaccharide biosynthesis WecB/TagA/CpsF family protein/anti-anti-sigma factor
MPTDSEKRILLFGLPVDSYSPEELQEKMEIWHEAYLSDLRPRFGTIINAIVLSQATWWPFKSKAPDVIQLIRSSDYVGLDSPFLQKCALLLGNPAALTSSDQLFQQAIQFCARTGKKIYLLGGNPGLCKKISEKLSKEHPHLKICGCNAPQIATKGLALEESIEQDSEIINAINKAKPDVLLIQLGHPKQDLWFGRISNRLKVPLSFGVGGAFERHLGVSEGPMGWSSLKRKISTFLHFVAWFPLLFLYNTVNRLLYDLIFSHFNGSKNRRLLFLSENDSLSVIPFPSLVNRTTWSKKPDWLEEAMEHDHIVLDLSKVRHIDLSGLSLLFQAAQEIERRGKKLFLLWISSELRAFIKLHGAWDYFGPFSLRSPAHLIDRLQNGSPFSLQKERDFVSLYQFPNETVINIFGSLYCSEDPNFSSLGLDSVLYGKNCTVDLKYCTSISNMGFGFLLKLRREQLDQSQKLTLTNVSRALKAQFKNAKLHRAFHFK